MRVDVNGFKERGHVTVSGLFTDDEVAAYRQHFMEMRRAGTYDGDFSGVDSNAADPLKRFPRLIHMHRWDQTSLNWMLDPRLEAVFEQLLGKAPLAVQTMMYFKPAGARGQALHQDQFYLRVQPGTCIAAWMALDDCDEQNGLLTSRLRQPYPSRFVSRRRRYHAKLHRCDGSAVRGHATRAFDYEGGGRIVLQWSTDPRQLPE